MVYIDCDSIINRIVSLPLYLELEESDNSILIDNCRFQLIQTK